MTELNEKAILRRRLGVAHQLEDQQQLAVFDDSRSELVLLNGTGAAVWTCLDGSTSLGDIALEMAEAVPGAPDRSEVVRLVLQFAGELLERGAVEIVER